MGQLPTLPAILTEVYEQRSPAPRCLPSTYPSTKLRETDRTGTTSDGLSKPERPHQTAFGRYRTQEVAGSSPASSIETPARQGFSSVRAARFVGGPSTGLYRFAQSLPHCIGEWELGERLRGAHACDEKVAESVTES